MDEKTKAKLGKLYHPGMEDSPLPTKKVQHPDDPKQFMVVNKDQTHYEGVELKPFVESKSEKVDDEKPKSTKKPKPTDDE